MAAATMQQDSTSNRREEICDPYMFCAVVVLLVDVP